MSQRHRADDAFNILREKAIFSDWYFCCKTFCSLHAIPRSIYAPREKDLETRKKNLWKLELILKVFHKSFHKNGIELLKKRWTDCIALEGD